MVFLMTNVRNVIKGSVTGIAYHSRIIGSLLLGLISFSAVAADELPSGASVQFGTVSIHEKLRNMTVVQSSPKAVVNWDTFNVGEESAVTFIQPGSESSILNRVTGQSPSKIMGNINSNGNVFLINQSGIVFGRNATIDVGGLVAGVLKISDDDFLNDRFQFYGSGEAGVVNYGRISAKDKGLIALLSPEIRNEGVIEARLGSVQLAAGTHITLKNLFSGVTVVIEESTVEALIENKSLVKSDDGTVYIGAGAAASLQKAVINNFGRISANQVTRRDGKILLESSVITSSGVLESTSQTDVGGTIKLSGDNIHLATGAIVNADGELGGGRIEIGGGWQGESIGARPSASTLLIDQDVEVTASAGSNGDGGRVVAWSDVNNPLSITEVNGKLEARGGSVFGMGGQIETSGAQLKVDNAQIDTRAPKGATGNWLIDPTNIEIVAGSGDTPANWQGSVIKADTLAAALASNNVTVLTSNDGSELGNIVVSSALAWTSGNELTLNAHNNIAINSTIDAAAGHGKLALRYGQGSANGGSSIYEVNAPINLSSAGSFTTQKGNTGTDIVYTIIDSLGASGSTTGTDLQGMQASTALSGNFVLGANIDASATANWNINQGFEPIGSNGARFAGRFNGLGHSISGLKINRSDDYQGLFGGDIAKSW